MEKMLTALCKELNNWFCKKKDVISGTFRIEDGVILPDVGLLDGQYYCVEGSALNDGVHHFVDSSKMVDEPEFEGTVYPMRIPPDAVDLAQRIFEWRKINEAADSSNMSPFQSESFGAYSYSKGSSGQSKNGGAGATAVTWQSQFASELNKYRRVWGI